MVQWVYRAAQRARCIDEVAVATGDVPPTLNLDDPCSECVPDGADFVRRVAARGVRVRAAMTNSFGFGGTNASLVFAAPPRLRG